MRLIVNFLSSQSGIVMIAVFLAVVIALMMIYRRFPLHKIYRSKAGFQSMLDAVDEPLAVISKEFDVRRVNKAYIDLVGGSYETSINAKCYGLLRGRSLPCDDCRLAASIKHAAAKSVETSPHPRGAGSLNITFTPYTIPAGKDAAEICVIEHIRDITELEELRIDLERRNNFLVTLAKRLYAARRSIKSELSIARQLQLNLLPSKPAQIGRMRIDMSYRPIADVGGDLYDFVRIDDNNLGIFVGDASGHGLASSLIGTLAKMSLYNHSRAGLSTAELLKRMNRDLNAHIHTSHYMTCFWGVLDFERGLMKYSRAGHPVQVVLRRDGTLHKLPGNGIFLGIDENAAYEEKVFLFEAGDRFFFFTDGIYDAFINNQGDNNKYEILGYEKFMDIVRQTAGTPFDGVIEKIKYNLIDFKHEDDYTLIVSEVCDA